MLTELAKTLRIHYIIFTMFTADFHVLWRRSSDALRHYQYTVPFKRRSKL